MVNKVDKSYLNEFKINCSQEYISKKEILEYDAKLNNLEKY
mgnify:FL=1